jgi:hypothetical protein
MANFLQLTPENIAQAKGMNWGQAFSQDFNPKNPNYRGFSTAYKGADRTGLGKYVTGGLKSLAGMFEPGSNVGGATPLTRKLALTAMDYGPKALGIASKFLGPASFLFDTSATADATMPQYGSEEYKAFMAKEALFRRKQKQTATFKKIREKELADATAAAKAKADAAAAAAKATSSFDPSGPTQASIRRDRADKSGRGHSGGFTDPGKGSYGPHKADGGLINFYRYGGFI